MKAKTYNSKNGTETIWIVLITYLQHKREQTIDIRILKHAYKLSRHL